MIGQTNTHPFFLAKLVQTRTVTQARNGIGTQEVSPGVRSSRAILWSPGRRCASRWWSPRHRASKPTPSRRVTRLGALQEGGRPSRPLKEETHGHPKP